MKLKLWIFAIVLALATLARGATNDLTGLLQKGLFEEEANRDLTAAIANYQSLANAFDKDRQLAATAVFRLGECYRKLGKTNEAAAQYQRIIKEFSDQQTLVTLSRQNLTGLNVAAAPAGSGATEFSFAELEANVATLQAQIQQIEKMPRNQARIFVQQNFPNPVLTELVQELDLSQQALIKLKVDYTPDHPKYKTAEELVSDLTQKVDAQVEGVLDGLRAKLDAAQTQLALVSKREGNASSVGENQTIVRLQIERARQQIAGDLGDLQELSKMFLPTNARVVDLKKRIDAENVALAALIGKLQAPQGAVAEGASPITDEEQQAIRNIQVMIQNSPDLINAPDSNGNTPLLAAAEKGQLLVAKYLLDHGANVDAISGNHVDVPLSSAARNGHKAMVELLLAHGADVNGHGVLNPLFEAVQKGYVAVAEVLLANKADVNARSTDGNRTCSLHIAARDGKTELVQLLLKHGADVNAPDNQGRTPLDFAATQNQIGAAKLLLASKASVEARDKSGNTALHGAADKGYAEMISLLLDSGAAVDPTNNFEATPLLLAANGNSQESVRVLLEHKADPNHFGTPRYLGVGAFLGGVWQPVFLAINNGNNDILKLLLDAGGDSDTNTPIFVAINKNNADAVQLLLEHGANPNHLDREGNPPLSLVLTSGKDKGMVSLLLDKGADANARDKDGLPPLAHTSDPEVGRWLVDHKADVNGRFLGQLTPLMAASDTNYIRFLLQAGANPDLQDTNGNTALHHYTIPPRPETVAVLLELKANPNIQNNTGYTPLDLARSGSVNGVVEGRLWSAGSAGIGVNSANERDIADLLMKAGGLANLPKRNRIEVRRASSVASALTKDSHGWNRYSLLEMIGKTYGFLSQSISGDWGYNNVVRSSLWDQYPRFPDFKNVVIYRREGASAKQKSINVNVEDILTSGDCSRDVWLEWGDVVEIPEADHPVDQHWDGPGEQIITSLTNCLARQVTINIKGAGTVVKLYPELEVQYPRSGLGQLDSMKMVHVSFMLRSVLEHSKLVRVSSDLSRVKVTRTDSQTKKKQEWTIDCTNLAQCDFWLRDGDMVDVPEK